jgi:hypothetical protein
MIDLGTVKPGSTIRIPWSSFDKDDGSSITATNYAAADILVYKDGGTTERASTAGFTATTDFDAKTGKHVAIIDLADNTTAGFYSAGSEYMVALDAVTVDAVTTGGWIARFRIGYPCAALDTTIATLASQTSFTLTAGPAEDDALNGFTMMAHDVASAVQAGMAYVLDYTGSTRTVTLVAGPTFTIATTDNVSFFPPIQVFGFGGVAGTFASGRPEVNASHIAGSAISQSGGVANVNVAQVSGDSGAADNLEAMFDGTGYDASASRVSANVIRRGTAQAGGGSTITLDAGASATDDFYNFTLVKILSGTGAGQSRFVSDYVGATRVATVARAWATNPDNTSVFDIHPSDSATISGTVDANVVSISGDTAAADNAESFFDGTGYAGTNNVIPTVTNVTNLHASAATAAALATVDGIVDDILLDTAEIGAAGAGLTNINLPDQTMNITGNITGNLSGSVGSVTGAVGSVTGNVGGNVAGSVASVTVVSDKTGYRLSSTGIADVWAYAVEGTWTAVQYMRLFASALLAKCSGMGTTTAVFRDVDDTKNRISATVDADGNRTAVGTRDGD